MEKSYKPTPELRERIQEIRDKLAHTDAAAEALSVEDLEAVSGGGLLDRPPLDPNKEINGWSYTKLHDILCWIHESYQDKNITVGFATDVIPSILWEQFKVYPYPAYIEQPMWRIWCPNALGF